MGGHGHGHEPPYTVPDYRIYKVEGIPELERTQKALAAQGLKDPWLRNEVWRYDVSQWGTESSRAKTFFLRGFRLGLAAALLTVAGTKAYDYFYPSKHGHGHDHGEHH